MTTIKLKDCANIKTGKLNSNAAVIGGIYPFFTCDPETSQIDYFSFDEEAILLTGNNASGKFNIKYYVGKFNAYQRTYIINSSTDILKTKYLYYFLSTKLHQFTTLSSGSATKFLTKALLDNCDIEVPSLDEQSHIVDTRCYSPLSKMARIFLSSSAPCNINSRSSCLTFTIAA